MKSAGKARNNGLYRHIRTSKEIIRNLLNDFLKNFYFFIPASSTPLDILTIFIVRRLYPPNVFHRMSKLL